MKNKYEQDPFERSGANRLTDQQMRESLSRIGKRFEKGRGAHSKIRLVWSLFAIAASVVIIYSVTTVFLSPKNSLQHAINEVNDRMSTIPLSATMTVEKTSSELQVLQDAASTYYNEENYPSAENAFAELHASYPQKPLYTMYLGDVYLKLGDYSKAEQLLSEALQAYQKAGNSDGVHCTSFFLGLTLASVGELERAKLLLEQVANNKRGYNKQAAAVLAKF